MKALSFSRPWDLVILHLPFKEVENRNWPTKYRGRIYVHRAKSWDKDGYTWLREHRNELGLSPQTLTTIAAGRFYVPVNGIVGEVDILDCVTKSTSPWFFGRYGFVLANPVAYETTIPYRGRPGLFDAYLCYQCKKPTGGRKFCEQCSEVGLEDDCTPD